MDRRFLIPFCGVLLAFNAFSCDIVLPTFFAIERDLGVAIEQVQAIVPVFLMAAGCAQLVFGPLSDRYGRRPVLIGGVAVYVVGSLLALATSSLALLYVSRALQGMGAACGVVIGRAMMRDTHSGEDLARAMALAMAIFAVGPLTAPLLGAGIMAVGGWRATFGVLAAFGATVMLLSLLVLKETNARPDATALEVDRLKAAFATVIRHPQSRYFLGIALLLQFTVTTLVISAPRLFKSAFAIEGAAFAVAFAFSSLGVIIGQLLSNRLIPRLGVMTTVRIATYVFLGNALMLAIAAHTGLLTAWLFTLSQAIYCASFLVIMTNCLSLYLDPHRQIAGMASSVYGFLTQTTGSALALLALPLTQGAVRPWSLLQVLIALIVAAAVLRYRPQVTVPQAG